MELPHKENNFYFWEKKIRDMDDILFGNMAGKGVTRDSVLLYIGILDRQKDIFLCGWSCHRDVNTALGFLQYVFLPSCFYTWVDRESDGFYIPMSPFEVLKEEVLRHATEQEAQRMEKDYCTLNNIWQYLEQDKKAKLKDFCRAFNAQWDENPEKKLFVRAFAQCEEIVDFILENAEEEFEEVLEEELEMSIEQLKFMCRNVYDEPLINKNIIELLNTRIPVWF